MPAHGAVSALIALQRWKLMSKTWTVVLDEDLATGELLLPLPDELIASLGWKEGDNLVWDVRADGSIELTKQLIVE